MALPDFLRAHTSLYVAREGIAGMVAPNVLLAWALFAFAGFLVYFYLSGLLWGSGYSPTPRRQLEAAASLLRLEEGDTVYDLGSGLGNAVVFFAKRYRASAIGVEIDPLRRLVALRRARKEGASGNIRVVRRNLMDVDLRGASKVFFFLTPLLMRRLQEKIEKEMPSGALVVSVDHRLPDWEPQESVENVHLYVVGRAA